MPADSAVLPDLPEAYGALPHTARRNTPRRRAVAKAMTLAAQVPTLTADVRVDLTALQAARATRPRSDEAAAIGRPSVLGLIAWAAVRTLGAFPAFNASWTEAALIQWKRINLGIAVDTPQGVVVPVVTDAAALDAAGLTAAIGAAAEKTRGRGLSLDDLAGGTFTISNPGSVGPSVRAEALLNVPQVAMLGLPGIVRQPVVVGTGAEERIEIRSTITPSLTFDHRAIDGGDAVRFLVALRDLIESADAAAYARPAREESRP